MPASTNLIRGGQDSMLMKAVRLTEALSAKSHPSLRPRLEEWALLAKPGEALSNPLSFTGLF